MFRTFVFCCFLLRCDAWGSVGHEVVAQVASSLLTNTSQHAISALLHGNATLPGIANWADEVREQPEWRWSEPLHFIDTPDWLCDGYNQTRDCPGGRCVEGAITNYTQQLSKGPVLDNEVALKFLVHYFGDIHQPLHVGFKGDRGGNSLMVHFLREKRRLHEVWDVEIIKKYIHDKYDEDYVGYADELHNRLMEGDYSKMVPLWLQCPVFGGPAWCPTAWAVESNTLACTYAYMHGDTKVRDGEVLDQAWYQTMVPIVETQLAKAAVRLAFALNNIFT